MIRYSRRQLAAYVASAILKGEDVIPKLAAYLIDNKRTKEANLLVYDIEKALVRSGTVVAHVTSAHEIDVSTSSAIEKLLQSKYGMADIAMRSDVDVSLLGGVVVRAAGEEFDGSLKRSINRLKALKV